MDHALPHDKTTGERIGQELAPDAAIWELYLEEANEHDQELVKSRHASLDMLLLFVGLPFCSGMRKSDVCIGGAVFCHSHGVSH